MSQTGTSASQTQILNGDSSNTIESVSESNTVKLKTLTANKKRTYRMGMVCAAIAEDAITATVSGTVETTTMEMFTLVMRFFYIVSQDFFSTREMSILVGEIESSKLTVSLTKIQIRNVFNVEKLQVLTKDIEPSINVISTHSLVVTGKVVVMTKWIYY